MPAKKSSTSSQKSSIIMGEKIYLRPLRQEDLSERYLGWLNDPEVNKYMESGIFPYTKDRLERFYEQVTTSKDQIMVAIIDKETDQHIGNVKLGPIDWSNRRATFGIMIGDKRFWGRGICVEVTRLMVEYAFFRLDLRRIDLGVYAEHDAAVSCYEKVGFRVEGRFRQDLFHEGKYKDKLWMGLLRSEYTRKQPSSGR